MITKEDFEKLGWLPYKDYGILEGYETSEVWYNFKNKAFGRNDFTVLVVLKNPNINLIKKLAALYEG